eukprot:TRINITY_DN17732_c0_g5_i1.p1 TRINITY_DN17732_c0_g5~~TRINITY_DN17732_c0_g5_i1.p1  ORF type:complete len:105 (+),score=7.98 TRINITY_DN17732_c0_g5_i1:219-533(+)
MREAATRRLSTKRISIQKRKLAADKENSAHQPTKDKAVPVHNLAAVEDYYDQECYARLPRVTLATLKLNIQVKHESSSHRKTMLKDPLMKAPENHWRVQRKDSR